MKSLNPIFVPDNSARENPNTSANPQHLDLFPVLSGTLPLAGLPPFPIDSLLHSGVSEEFQVNVAGVCSEMVFWKSVFVTWTLQNLIAV